MEVRVRERLIGALVLVAIVVLVVPAILTGRGSAPAGKSADPPAQPARRVEMPAGDMAPVQEEQILVPEPVADTPAQEAEEKAVAPVAPAAGPREAQPRAAETKPAEPARRNTPEPAPAASATAPAAGMQAPAWAVQLGAFSNRAKAEQLVAELRKRRYAAFVLEYRASGQVLYRVRVGPEQDRARAEEIAARLAKDGFQPVVARHP
jgi:DedD protein